MDDAVERWKRRLEAEREMGGKVKWSGGKGEGESSRGRGGLAYEGRERTSTSRGRVVRGRPVLAWCEMGRARMCESSYHLGETREADDHSQMATRTSSTTTRGWDGHCVRAACIRAKVFVLAQWTRRERHGHGPR